MNKFTMNPEPLEGQWTGKYLTSWTDVSIRESGSGQTCVFVNALQQVPSVAAQQVSRFFDDNERNSELFVAKEYPPMQKLHVL